MGKRKRTYQWVGLGRNIDVKTDASTAPADIMEIIPAISRTAVGGPQTSCLIEAMYIKVHTRREAISALDAAAVIVWTGTVIESGDAPLQSLDAIATDARAYANKNIMLNEPIEVPPLLGASDLLSFVTNDQVLVSSFQYQASRKLDRSTQVLCLAVNADVSAVLNCFVQARVLLSYGS